MNTLKAAVHALIVGDVEYLELMGYPPEPVFNTFYKRRPAKPTFPETILDFAPAEFDSEIDEELLVSRLEFNITVWAVDDGYEGILDRVIILLHGTNNDIGLYCRLVRDVQELYDPEFNAYGKNVLFAGHYRRPNR